MAGAKTETLPLTELVHHSFMVFAMAFIRFARLGQNSSPNVWGSDAAKRVIIVVIYIPGVPLMRLGLPY